MSSWQLLEPSDVTERRWNGRAKIIFLKHVSGCGLSIYMRIKLCNELEDSEGIIQG
jgi:hypothetical protein